MAPWWFAIVIIPAIGVSAWFAWRRFQMIKGKVDRGETRWEDDWDPFQ